MRFLSLILLSLSIQSAFAGIVFKLENASIHHHDCVGGVEELYVVKPGYVLLTVSGVYNFNTISGPGSNSYTGLPVIGKITNLREICDGHGQRSNLTLTFKSGGSMFELLEVSPNSPQ